MREHAVGFLRSAGWVGIVGALMLAVPSVSWASPAVELGKAKEKGRVAFVLVTEPGASGVEEAEQVIREALKTTKKSVMIQLDRTKPENAELVSRYRLTGPQIPLVLVFAPNGVIAGGGIAQGLTAERLLGMVPTKKEAELIEALQSGRAVLVLASRRGMAGVAEALKDCEKAREISNGNLAGTSKLAIVRVDMTDGSEQALMKKLQINTSSQRPVTVVISSRGQVTGAFEGPTDPAALILASNKVAGGCCPGGAKAGAVCAPVAKR